MNYEDEMILKELLETKKFFESLFKMTTVFGGPHDEKLIKYFLDNLYIKLGFSSPTITQKDKYDLWEAEAKDQEAKQKYV